MTEREKERAFAAEGGRQIRTIAKIMQIEFGSLIHARTNDDVDWVEIVDAVLCEYLANPKKAE